MVRDKLPGAAEEESRLCENEQYLLEESRKKRLKLLHDVWTGLG